MTVSVPRATLRGMAEDIDPEADPNTPARCPRRFRPGGARCRALVLVRDAHEHGAWHDDLEAMLAAPVDVAGSFVVGEWPADDAARGPIEPAEALPAIDRPAGL